MPKFILHSPAGLTWYLLISNAEAQLRRTDTTVFEDEDLGNLPQYAYPLTAGAIPFRYTADIPADLPGGPNGTTALYTIQPMQQVDAEPSGLDEAPYNGVTLQWDGENEVAVASASQLAEATSEAVVEAIGGGAAEAEKCRVYGYTGTGGARAKERVKVQATILSPPQTSGTVILSTAPETTYSGSGGYWYLDLVRGATYTLTINDEGINETILVPDQASVEAGTLL